MVKTRQTQLVSINIPQTTNSGTAYIAVGFNVKTIHCKSASMMVGTPPVAGSAVYVVIKSDLTRNDVIASTYADNTYPMNTNNDIFFEFDTPQPVNGYYNFYVYNVDGSPYAGSNGGDDIGLILEFNAEYDA